MKNCFYPMLIAFLVLSGLIMGTATVRAWDLPQPPEPNCACGYCNRPCGSGHAPDCPSYNAGGGGGGGGSEERAPYNPANAPIFVAPVGLVGGLFMGAGWFFSEMAGSNPDDGFFSSYHKYLSVKTDNDRFDSAFNFGSHIGAVPWLALAVPAYPIRMGVVAVHDVATRPSPPKPKPVDPNIAVYDLIARINADSGKITDGELKKAKEKVEAAMARRTRMLDEYINDSQELQELKEKEGVAAARARAEKQLDAMSKARDDKQKISMALVNSIHEKNAAMKDAVDKANPIGFFVDLNLSKKEMDLETAVKNETLPQGAKDSLSRELKVTRLLKTAKEGYDIGTNVMEIKNSYKKASDEGKDVDQWYREDPEVREKVLRLGIKVLSHPLSNEAGMATGTAENTMDIAYAVTAQVLLTGQVADETAALEKLQTAHVFQDVKGGEWKDVTIAVKAAQANEATIRSRGDQYKKMQKENEDNAKRLRALGWKFE